MTDRLSALLQQFELRTRVFFAGQHCGVSSVPAEAGVGHLHLLRRGVLEVTDVGGRAQRLEAPCLLLYGQPAAHRLSAPLPAGADIVCAEVSFGIGQGNPLLHSLPQPLILQSGSLLQDGRLLDLLFEEAFGGHCGQAVAVNRLMEVLMVHLLRHVMQSGQVQAGALAGLADPRLSKALVRLHEAPGQPWSLAALAAEAGMSRARFAAHFRRVVGMTPGDYLAAWRVSLAMGHLRRGRAVGWAATEVGYRTAAAFSRAFQQQLGRSPRDWLRTQRQ